MSKAKADELVGDYKYGFTTDAKTVLTSGKGLSRSVVEFISLMFTGKFRDKKFKKHGIEFDLMDNKDKKEMEDMAVYFSEVAE